MAGRPRAIVPDQERQAAQMRAEGKSYLAIGEALGISDKTAKASVERWEREGPRAEREAQKRLAAFHAWADEGRKRGWLSAVLAAALKPSK